MSPMRSRLLPVSRRDHHRLLDDRYTVDDVGLHSVDELTL